jgi:hypothetical protein
VRNRILGPSSRPYSPKLVEEVFCELRVRGFSEVNAGRSRGGPGR